MAQKRIAVLTMSLASPRLMLAGERDGILHIIECKTLDSNLSQLQSTLPDKLDALRKKGFVLLVDEVMPHFARYGRAVKLSDLDASGRPIIVSAMEAYRNLKAYKAITYPSGTGSQYDISPSIVDEVRGTDGKTSYLIDWEVLKPQTVALLFVVYAATQDSFFDATSMKSLFNELGIMSRSSKPANRFANIVTKINRDQLSTDIFDKKGG
jgi:hypothetical protein